MADRQLNNQQQSLFPRILSNRANTRYVELSTHYSDHADWYGAIQRLEASFNGETITLCQLQSEEPPIKLMLNAQAMDMLIIGYLNYLTDQGLIITGPVADNPVVQAFTTYVHVCEMGRFQPPARVASPADDNLDDDLGALDEAPF